MTPDRDAHLIEQLSTIKCADELRGFVDQLRSQSELSGSLPLEIVQLQKRTGWTIRKSSNSDQAAKPQRYAA